MTLTFAQAFQILENASAVILPNEPGCPLIYPAVHDDNESSDFMEMGWNDEEYRYDMLFYTVDNQVVEVKDNSLVCIDSTGTPVEIVILMPMTLPQLEGKN